MKKQIAPKIIDRQYAVKINDEIAVVKKTRKEIQDYARNIKLDDSVHTIELVRHNITEFSIKKYTTSTVTQKILVPSELTLDLDKE